MHAPFLRRQEVTIGGLRMGLGRHLPVLPIPRVQLAPRGEWLQPAPPASPTPALRPTIAVQSAIAQMEMQMSESSDLPSRRLLVRGLTPARESNRARAAAAAAVAGAHAPTASPMLIGHGYDIHRLRAGGRLVLAGVVASDEISPVAHSDGDVIFHAVTDALLGALGQGDIGEVFPNTDPRWKNADSRIFLDDAVTRARARGYRLASLDVTLLLERPKIGAFKPEMVRSLRHSFGTGAVINVKAGTNEGCDAVGQGAAVAAWAVLLLMAGG